MDKKMFEVNFLKSLNELDRGESELPNLRFTIELVKEGNVKYNSKDDYMRLTIFNKKNLENKCFDINKVTKMLSALSPLYPLWIELFLAKNQTDTIIIRMSLRFRKPSELKYQETGHPPFIVKK